VNREREVRILHQCSDRLSDLRLADRIRNGLEQQPGVLGIKRRERRGVLGSRGRSPLLDGGADRGFIRGARVGRCRRRGCLLHATDESQHRNEQYATHDV
jgi:hypothetical protein